MNKSHCKQTIAWCYENGKSFEYNNAIYNINKLGADINLLACCSVGEDEIFKVAGEKVNYFNPLCDLSSMEEDKEYIVSFYTGSDKDFKSDVLKVLQKTSSAIYFTNGMCNDLDGLDISVFSDQHNNIVNFQKLKRAK